jgi:hypothetical protein
MTEFRPSGFEQRKGDRRAPETLPLQPEKNEGWHLDKKVPISLIAGMIAQVFIGAWWVTSQLAEQRKDLELVKADITVLHQRDTTNSDAVREALKLMQEQYRLLDNKLDRLIERAPK